MSVLALGVAAWLGFCGGYIVRALLDYNRKRVVVVIEEAQEECAD
jgi:hypothetical protein